MTQSLRTGSAVSLIVIASMIAGCATPQSRVATHFGGKADGDLGLATRALAALNSNNLPLAIELGERAVAKTPNDAGFRALLGNAYFAAGRFQSAESAYKDSLTVYSNQPQVVLKLALVEIALGKSDQAVAFLDAARDVIDVSNYGLALALAGRPADAIAVLQPAARAQGADATVRQNLALAYGLAGDWTNARTIAAQDVPAGQLDTRVRQWMLLATPARPSDQVAALVGVKPAAVDQGQPVQLALNKAEARQPVQSAAAAPQAQPQTFASVPETVAAVAPAADPAFVEAVAPAPPPPRPVSAPASKLATFASAAVSEAKAVLAAVMPAKPKPAALRRVAAAKPAVRRGNSPTVVQLGAYGSAERVVAAWNASARKYAALRPYAPMSARFSSPRGTFYRLSVHGFASVGEANSLCASLRRSGGTCFVRGKAGDTPVQYASR